MSAANAVGQMMLKHRHGPKRAQLVTQHDIKLELDVRCQRLIEKQLRQAFPQVAVLGEEGVSGASDAGIAGWWTRRRTVNFTYGIPHACVSIALQGRAARPTASTYPDGFDTLVGVVYDPSAMRLDGHPWPACATEWTRDPGEHAAKLAEAIVSIVLRRAVKRLTPPCPTSMSWSIASERSA
jgi:3'-phosphoadenosine 5'-phosphosulfate (PAPS) 3'-phosphatase